MFKVKKQLLQKKKNKLMKNATNIIKKKLKDKKDTKKMKKDKKILVFEKSDSNLVVKKYLELIKKSKTSEKIQLNDQ